MVDLPDVEFKYLLYLVSCYGDYAKYKAYYGAHPDYGAHNHLGRPLQEKMKKIGYLSS